MRAPNVARPDLPMEDYVRQNEWMIARYRRSMARHGLSWDGYYRPVPRKLLNSPYYIWIFLCGCSEMLDGPVIFDDEIESLYDDRDRRCWSIVGQHVQERQYVKSLNGELF